MLLLLATLASALAGSTDLGLSWGVHGISRDDAIFSPLPARGVTPLAFQVDLRSRIRSHTHRAVVAFASARTRTAPAFDYGSWPGGETRETFPTSMTLVDFRYAYGRRIALSDGWTLYVGGATDNRLDVLDWSYDWFTTFGYLGSFDLAPWAELEWVPTERHRGTLEVWTPVVSWTARSPYAIHDDEYIAINADHNDLKSVFGMIGDGRVESLHDHQALHVRAAWSYAVSERIALFTEGRFDLLHLTHPRPLLDLRYGLDVGARVRF